MGKAMDPFDSAPVALTHNVQRLLTYFESLFLSNTAIRRSQENYLSASRNVIRDAIFDEVQVKCLLASLASRREIFDHQAIPGGATWYIHQATVSLQQRLQQTLVIDLKLMYAMMKLYVAEAYQSNAEGALVHLRGAQAAYNHIGTWHDFDTNYTPTLCASGEAFFVRRVWTQPTSFPTLADPGIASSCFSFNMIQTYVLPDKLSTEKGNLLLDSLSKYHDPCNNAATLHQIVVDLLEYSTVKQNMLLRENSGLEVPILVSQWSHLRRFAIVFRLMSVPIVNDDFLHMLRVALVLWLQIIANYVGFNKSLQIVAVHLQEVVSSIPYEKLLQFPEITIWVSLLGVSIGDADTKAWFAKKMLDISWMVDAERTWSMEEWRAYLVRISEECLFCDLLQRQGVLDVTRDIFLAILQEIDTLDINSKHGNLREPSLN
jgi:hypothetical protein